jgi:hypothetical protein
MKVALFCLLIAVTGLSLAAERVVLWEYFTQTG